MDISPEKRNVSLDVARIAAVLAVIMTHCCAGYVVAAQTRSTEFILSNILDSISRIGVPLFLMISGALFLDERKEVTLKGILSKNVKSLAIITVIWATVYSVAYNIVYPLRFGGEITAKNVIMGILNGHEHMWYLYMIIGLYTITPFLKKIVCKENKDMVLAFIVISFAVQFLIPTVSALCSRFANIDFIENWVSKFNLDFFGGYITYFLMGWYVINIGLTKRLKYILYAVGAVSLASIILHTQLTGSYIEVYRNIGAPVFLYSVAVFVFLTDINYRFNEKTEKVLITFSKLTFGVYIIHMLILNFFSLLFTVEIPFVLYMAVYFVTCTVASFAAAYVISKIPVLKKLIKA